ncbi:autotransporter domain-containing protein [Mesorhizobium sp.]|uniref:autotransporter domain-containing protein n=1 Tax=Mesorhizobium sp. TaxID=1871066 RepID=UPI0025C2C30B|nr:autotransporter domain-containing protein [Mesorhizobium sp.]
MPQNTFGSRKATGLKHPLLTPTAPTRYLNPSRNPRHMASVSLLALMLGSAGLGVVALPAPVAADEWTGATSGDWFTTGNWDTGAVPTSSDDVSIATVSPNATVVNGANALAHNVFLGDGGPGILTISNGGTLTNTSSYIGWGGAGTVNVTGAGSAWISSLALSLGVNGGDGVLVVSNGATVASTGGHLGVGYGGATGAVTVDGAGSNWTNSSDLFVGDQSSGTLMVSNGGAVSNALGYVGYDKGSTGTATVTGAGSTWTNSSDLYVGDYGTGTLMVLNGGSVSNVEGIIGNNAGSTGTVTIAGIGSTWANSSSLYVGQGGAGTLTILNGGAVSNDQGIVGTYSDSTGTAIVDGAGSTWTNASSLIVGAYGTGALTISNGGAVSNTQGYVGYNGDSAGTVEVDGPGSVWANSSDLFVGYGGTGTMIVSNAGMVSNTNGYVGVGAGLTSTATVTGASSWTNSSDLFVGYGGAGVLTVSNAGTVSNAFGIVGYNAGSTGTITVDGAGSIWTNSSDLYVGYYGTAILTISNGGAVSAGSVVLAANADSIGTLNIGGASGSAATAAGTVTAAAIQFGLGSGTLNFNHIETNYGFASGISGLGTINQIAGNTNMTGNSSGFTGTTNVFGGGLYVNGSLGGAINVTGGLLGGSGTAGNVIIASGGTFAPGNSIGTINVSDTTFLAGSTYAVEVESGGTSDLISATGTVTLSGGTVDVIAYPDYALGTTYTIVTAAGGVTGTFDSASLEGGSVFIAPTLTYDANNVYLDLAKTSFASVAMTPNQIAAAGGADSLGTGNALYDAIFALGTASEAQTAFDAISGEIHASAKGMLLEDSRFIRDAATNRISAAFGDAGAAALPVMAYGEGGSAMAAADTDRFAVWGQAFGSWGDTDSNGNAAAFDRSTGGLLAGADGLVGDGRVGLLGGYSHASFDADDRQSSGDSDSYHIGLYGGTNWGAVAFRTGAAYSWNSISTKRSVAFDGFADALSADYDASTAQVFGELAYKVDADRFRFEPFANLAHVSVHTEGFTEKGGVAALTSQSSNTDATFTTFGLRASADVGFGGIKATARGTLGWRHAFGDVTPTATFAFAGGDASTIGGVPVAGDSAVIEAGFDLQMSANATLGLFYAGQFGAHAADNGAKANLNVRF